jgi:sugar lactone lactonase YvrE
MHLTPFFKPPRVVFAALALLVSGCAGPDSEDWLPEGAFTPGIEGPATDADGNVYAVNYQEDGTIGRVTPKGEASVFLRLPEGSIGNGIGFDRAGNMFIADYVKHRVYRVAAGTNTAVIWAENPAMNQPNDLCVHPDGSLYLSDPNWAESTGQLWRVSPEGETRLLEAGMGTTNGITLSPDRRFLYVNESVQRNVWRYRLNPDGSLGEKELLIGFDDFGLDGMRCDLKGNLYLARYDKGVVAVVSPEGELLKEYRLTGKKPSNLTFGGPDGLTCYITMADRGCFELIRALHPGAGFSE